MLRLLQGDVGAGKTIVALEAMLIAVEAGAQAALLAPTEILARQHYESLRRMAEPTGARVALLTGRDKYKISGSSAGNEPIAPDARTAMVMPICNEDVPRVFAGLRATLESVAASGNLDRFDFFVLSDTNDTDSPPATR